MNMPFYVAPEQVMKDRADYARKGIARGRALVAVRYADGIAIVAENTSETLRKVSEIYDRIAFAGVGKYNEFDQLRVAGVRAADLKGFQYSRDDVDARSLANQYAQILGQIFTHEMKPMEVEILVAEVGAAARRRPDVPHPLRRHGLRPARPHRARRRCRRHLGAHRASRSPTASTLGAAVRAGAAALAGPDRTLPADDLEVALLARGNGRRCFRRLHRRADRRPATARLTPVGRPALAARRTLGDGVDRSQQRPRRGATASGSSATTRRCSSVVTSANVACGFHAGDPSTLRRGVRGGGRQPACRSAPRCRYPDLLGFGRRFIDIDPLELRDAVLYQLGALDAFAQVAGAEVAYVKPHGALYHATHRRRAQAEAVVAAAAEYDPSLAVLGAPGSCAPAGRRRRRAASRSPRRSPTGPTCATAASCRAPSPARWSPIRPRSPRGPCGWRPSTRSSPSTARSCASRPGRSASTATRPGAVDLARAVRDALDAPASPAPVHGVTARAAAVRAARRGSSS